MLRLPNNCRAGKMSVFPKNWKTLKASTKSHWYISYRFYDDNLKKNKQVVIKGMNVYSELPARQQITQEFLDDEIKRLQQGLNRITDKYVEPVLPADEIPELEPQLEEDLTEHTPFISALYFALPQVKCVRSTQIDIESVLKYVRISAMILGIADMPISQVKRKHIVKIFEKTKEMKLAIRRKLQAESPGNTIKENWTANTFNYYRAHLSMVFKRLFKIEVIETNVVEGIDKEKAVEKIRETLSKEQRRIINGYLRECHPSFWRFLQVFFHSGARIKEVLNVRRCDVDLDRQRFKITVLKGQTYREEWCVIKDIILPLWEEAYNETADEQYLFSEGLIAGNHAIRREQITRRWRRHIKNRFNITADFYSLKASNLDEIAAEMDARAAQEAARHATLAVTKKHYLPGEGEREKERIRSVNNAFA
ncbi:tyrosine-type recombinase/integrase [Deminuibacter soli]|uniref:Tyr recombinase domain-containing protein n=1 Tax=Deminuibacter soli TaxID=2291815 RepID=A0A3E1NQ11_9BACT|nr:tyrosine-type recombinase/integrase [Deminuibacter soli]RFM30012.1 hypothetical protein DXN05_03305 [Deminuibacter soli]